MDLKTDQFQDTREIGDSRVIEATKEIKENLAPPDSMVDQVALGRGIRK